MDPLTERKQRVLDALDAEISWLEIRLKKVQPLMDELNSLRQTRRVLLSEKSTTSGGGRADTQLTMEMMVHYLTENGASKPGEIAEALGVPAGSVRAHLSRHKDVRYERDENGYWSLIGDTEGDDD